MEEETGTAIAAENMWSFKFYFENLVSSKNDPFGVAATPVCTHISSYLAVWQLIKTLLLVIMPPPGQGRANFTLKT